jgi:hypothetical protein
MTTESTETATATNARHHGQHEPPACAIAVNAAKVLDTTRRAWANATLETPAETPRQAPRAAQKKRVTPRRTRWPSLIAALNYWSPKPL